MQFWLDPEAGYAVRKDRLWYVPKTGAPVLMRAQVVELREYGDGLWGPDSYTRWDYRADGTLEDTTYGKYAPDFQLNAPLDEEAFELVPPGILIVHEEDDAPAPGYVSP